MSITLPDTQLNNIPVGSGGFIDLSGISGGGGVPQYTSDNPPTIRIHNESGSGLKIGLPNSGSGFNLPAGGWIDTQPGQAESKIEFTVTYILPNAPVSLLQVTYFFPGETVPPMTLLGNSPIGGSSMTVGNTLSNEGNASPLLVIDMGDTNFPQLITVYNDGHMAWNVDNAGTKVPVFHIDTLGNFIIDTIKGLTTGLINNPIDNTSWAAVSGTSGIIDTRIQASHMIRLQVPGGTDIMVVDNNQVVFNQNPVLGAGTALSLLVGSLARLSTVSFNTVNGTTAAINHGLGVQPVWGFAIAYTTGISSANVTIGLSEVNSTTFKASSIAAVPAIALFGK